MSLNSFRLTHEVPVLLSHRNQLIDLHNANQLTGFYMRATLALNGLMEIHCERKLNEVVSAECFCGFDFYP